MPIFTIEWLRVWGLSSAPAAPSKPSLNTSLSDQYQQIAIHEIPDFQCPFPHPNVCLLVEEMKAKRIEIKTLVFVYKCFTGNAPSYLSEPKYNVKIISVNYIMTILSQWTLNIMSKFYFSAIISAYYGVRDHHETPPKNAAKYSLYTLCRVPTNSLP